MRHLDSRKSIVATAAFILLSGAALWSLNAVSGLFHGPELQYKYVLAGLILLAILRIGVTGRNLGRRRRHGRSTP